MRLERRLAKLEAASAALVPDERAVAAVVSEVEAFLGTRLDALRGERHRGALRLVAALVSAFPSQHSFPPKGDSHRRCGCTGCGILRQAFGFDGGCEVCSAEHEVVGSLPHDGRRWLGDRLETRGEATARGVGPEHLGPMSRREAIRTRARMNPLTP